MSDLTKAQLAAWVLEHLGIKSATDSADAADQARVEETIDVKHDQLRKRGLAPFATSAIEEWAQTPLRDIVAADVAQTFGISGQRLLEFKAAGKEGERELARQVAGFRHPMPIQADYF